MAQLGLSQGDLNQGNAPDVSGSVPSGSANRLLGVSQADLNNPTGTDYENMPWNEVLGHAVKNLAPSAISNLESVPKALYNYNQTFDGLKQLGSGLVSKAKGALGAQQDPAQKANDEAALNQQLAPWSELLHPSGSHAQFKQALAEDPFSVISMAALPLGGGEFAAGKLLGEGSKVAGTLGVAANAVNPTGLALSAAGKLASGVPKAQALATGASEPSLQTAFQSGKPAFMGGPNAAQKQVFSDFASGNGNPVDFSRAAEKAFKQVQDDQFNQWKQNKANVFGGASGNVDPTPVYNAIAQTRAGLGSPSVAIDQAPFQALDTAEGSLNDRIWSADPSDRGVEGYDRLKRDLYNYAQQQPTNTATNALMNVHNAVRGAIEDTAPGYSALMEQYQKSLDGINNIKKTLGSGSNIAANSELAKVIRQSRNPQGQSLIDQLSEKDPRIPYMVAGSDLHNAFASGRAASFEGSSAVVHALNVMRAVSTGNPSDIVASASAPFAQMVLQSPAAMRRVNQAAGSTLPVAQAAGVGARYAAPVLSAPTGDNGYAKGGKVKKPSHEYLVNRLMALAEKAKRAEKKATAPILNLPDDTVTAALAKAQEAI